MSPSLANPNPGRTVAGLKSPSSIDTLRITTCKLCPAGVYKGQAKTWGTGIGVPIGWSHAGCVEAGGGVVRA
jgi:hypothetical protein